tara:strand:- start:197 stop:490 length:294 start_codon:yes stop_codon:yes gene_type:complete
LLKLSPEVIEHLPENAVILDGFDCCVVGVVNSVREQGLLLYDTEKIINLLQKRDNMSEEEALEYFAYNIRGAYFGEGSPLFLDFSVKDGNIVYGNIV